MKNLFQRLQARKKERRIIAAAAASAAGNHDGVTPQKQQQPPESSRLIIQRGRRRRWNDKKRGRATTSSRTSAVVVSAVPPPPDEIPRSVTLETRESSTAFSADAATTRSTSTAGGEHPPPPAAAANNSNKSSSRRSVNSSSSSGLDHQDHSSSRSAYSDLTTRHCEYDDPGDDDGGGDDNGSISSSQNDNYFEVDYRGHFVEKAPAPAHEALLKLALDASACVATAASRFPKHSADVNKRAVSSSLLDKSGSDLFEQGNIDQAVCKYEEALKVKRQALLGQYNALRKQKGGMSEEQRAKILASVATSINNLTYLRQVQGRSSAGETLASYETALEIKRDILGPEHLSVGKTLNNIGSVHYLQRDYHAAAESYEQARDILKLNLGDHHLDICTVTSNLGDVHYCLRQWKRAVAEYRAALQLRWKLLGPADPKVVRLMEQIAELEMKITQMNRGPDDDGSDCRSEGEACLDDDGGFEALQAEINQEIQHLDSLQKQAPLDMVKDKTRVFRELRELRGDEGVVVQVEDDDDASGQRAVWCSPDKVSMHPSVIGAASEKEEDEPHCETSSVHVVSSVSVAPDSPTRKEEQQGVVPGAPPDSDTRDSASTSDEPSENSSKMSRQLTAQERLHALSSVKSRLAQLRAERGERSNVDSPPLSPTTSAPTVETETSKLSPSQLLKTSELLTIKQGIHSLRSGGPTAAAASQTKPATDLSSSLIETSSLARKYSLLAEKRRTITRRTSRTRPSHFS